MDLALAGRVAIITGPAKGMGAAVTRAFAREGCRLALIGRDVDAIAPVADEVTARGATAIVIPCDVTDAAQCEEAAERTHDCGWPIDGSAVEPHDLQAADDATDGGGLELPHNGAIRREDHQLQPGTFVNLVKEYSDQHHVQQ